MVMDGQTDANPPLFYQGLACKQRANLFGVSYLRARQRHPEGRIQKSESLFGVGGNGITVVNQDGNEGATMSEIAIGNTFVGCRHPCYIVAEIGINHNGDINVAHQLIDVAVSAGCNAVKFQKRTVDVVYTKEELACPRETQFGRTNGDLKRALEFGPKQYNEIDSHCHDKGISWFASCWDEASVDFIDRFHPPAFKNASASLTDDNLLAHVRSKGKPIILSTGMSRLDQIDHAVKVLGNENLVILHSSSTYPAYYDELNLRVIPLLRHKFPVPIGYSGHEIGILTSVAAVALGACLIERHLTLDRSLWGSDHSASLEPDDMSRLVSDIRLVETALGDGVKRVLDREIGIMQKLRRVDGPRPIAINDTERSYTATH
jgi:N-acetylneuraminate synthase